MPPQQGYDPDVFPGLNELAQKEPDKAAFLNGIAHNPHDDAPRLIMADWLDEHGEGLAAARVRWMVHARRTALHPSNIAAHAAGFGPILRNILDHSVPRGPNEPYRPYWVGLTTPLRQQGQDPATFRLAGILAQEQAERTHPINYAASEYPLNGDTLHKQLQGGRLAVEMNALGVLPNEYLQHVRQAMRSASHNSVLSVTHGLNQDPHHVTAIMHAADSLAADAFPYPNLDSEAHNLLATPSNLLASPYSITVNASRSNGNNQRNNFDNLQEGNKANITTAAILHHPHWKTFPTPESVHMSKILINVTAKFAPRTALLLAKKLPSWVPVETPGKESTTGFIANPDSQSWIAGLKYKPDTGAEMVVKKGGKSYPYPGINLAMFRRWVAAQSKGKWWWRNIGHVAMSRYTGRVHPLMTPQADVPQFTYPEHQQQALSALSLLLGRKVEPHHLAALGGFVPGTQMRTHLGIQSGKPRVELSSVGDWRGINKLGLPFSDYSTSRSIYRDPETGNIKLYNESMRVAPNTKYSGVSGAVLMRQMRAAHELGIPKIDWYAMNSADKEYQGGTHWPLIGANGYVPHSVLQQLPDHIYSNLMQSEAAPGEESGITFNQLFQHPGMKEWYAKHPTSHDAFVDTTPGSYSRLQVERHVGENALRYGNALPHPDTHFTHQLPFDPESQQPRVVQYTPANPPPVQRTGGMPTGLHNFADRVSQKAEEAARGGGGRQSVIDDEAGRSKYLRQFSRLGEFFERRKMHPMTEHVLRTGSLHPDYYDKYFEI